MNILILDKSSLSKAVIARCFSAMGPQVNIDWVKDAESAFDYLQKTSIDILFTEIVGVGFSCYELISKTVGDYPNLDVIVYTSLEDRKSITTAFRAGANGYLLKGCPSDDVFSAITIVQSGGAAMSPVVSRTVVKELQENSLASSLDILTRREKEVFQCIEEGSSYKLMSLKLNISRNTVHTHIKNIYSKLQAVDKHDALNKAKKLNVAYEY